MAHPGSSYRSLGSGWGEGGGGRYRGKEDRRGYSGALRVGIDGYGTFTERGIVDYC